MLIRQDPGQQNTPLDSLVPGTNRDVPQHYKKKGWLRLGTGILRIVFVGARFGVALRLFHME